MTDLIQEIDKLKAENAEWKDRCDEAERDRQDLFHELNDSTHEITKITRQRDRYRDAVRFVVDDASKPIEQIGGYFIGEETLIHCEEALQEAEGIE